MKRFLIFLAAFSFALSLFGQEKTPQLKDQKDRVSYSIGLNIGSNLGRQNVQINPDALAAGIKDAIAGKPQLTQDQVKETMAAFEKDMMEKQKAAADKNASEGAKFLMLGHKEATFQLVKVRFWKMKRHLANAKTQVKRRVRSRNERNHSYDGSAT